MAGTHISNYLVLENQKISDWGDIWLGCMVLEIACKFTFSIQSPKAANIATKYTKGHPKTWTCFPKLGGT